MPPASSSARCASRRSPGRRGQGVGRRRGSTSTRRRRRRPSPSTPARRRPAPAGARLHRQDRHAGGRPVRAGLRDAATGKRRAPLHAVRELATRGAWCRAGTSRSTRRPSTSRSTVPRGADGGQQHAGGGARDAGGRRRARALRADAEDVHVPAVPGDGRVRARDGEGGRDRGRRGHAARAPSARRASCSTPRASAPAEYNDYFGAPYPLPKLDNVAAPGRSQFFGAMENWGAILSFEYILLVDPVDLDRRRTGRASSRWPRTRSRTSGSATW